uniref:Uncharacterized protein n=1 Tax=Panagrolaimus sp. JU765 TaxID=591449 RepID=A0AC34RNG1_9BILA
MSFEAQQIYEQLKVIMQNNNLTLAEECAKIAQLIAGIDKRVEKELMKILKKPVVCSRFICSPIPRFRRQVFWDPYWGINDCVSAIDDF